jgi:hypothetical protein
LFEVPDIADDVGQRISGSVFDRFFQAGKVRHAASDIFKVFVVGVGVGLKLDGSFGIDDRDDLFGDIEDISSRRSTIISWTMFT